MKIRTADLSGAQLDYWTARAQGVPAERLEIRQVPRTDTLICVKKADKIGSFDEGAAYSTDWSLCGLLIVKCHIFLGVETEGWKARPRFHFATGIGHTPPVAVCRAVVRASFGDEVEEVAVCE